MHIFLIYMIVLQYIPGIQTDPAYYLITTGWDLDDLGDLYRDISVDDLSDRVHTSKRQETLA